MCFEHPEEEVFEKPDATGTTVRIRDGVDRSIFQLAYRAELDEEGGFQDAVGFFVFRCRLVVEATRADCSTALVFLVAFHSNRSIEPAFRNSHVPPSHNFPEWQHERQCRNTRLLSRGCDRWERAESKCGMRREYSNGSNRPGMKIDKTITVKDLWFQLENEERLSLL